MKLFNNKKGFIQSYGDLFKGFIIGLVIGAIIIYLMHKGIIPIALP